MKKLLCILFVLFFAFNVKAQIWCPPGTTWHYNKIIFGGNGYTRVTYAGTVTVNAKVCQQLNGFTEYYDPTSIPSQVTSYTLIPYYTYFSNNVVFLKDAFSNAFDTLYDFNAIPGSKWLLPERYSNMFFNRTVPLYFMSIQIGPYWKLFVVETSTFLKVRLSKRFFMNGKIGHWLK